jgi:hypothetical protein
LQTRRKTILWKIRELKREMPSLLQRLDRYWRSAISDMTERITSNLRAAIATVQKDFPDQYATAEASGQPLNFAEIERLDEAKAQHKPLTFQMLRP